VNDVIGAGSAVRGTLEDVRACGGEPVVLASLAVLGSAAQELAERQHLVLEALTMVPNTIWEPAACPLCARGVPLADPEGA
jgi:orotate phosphoribosyltransferase